MVAGVGTRARQKAPLGWTRPAASQEGLLELVTVRGAPDYFVQDVGQDPNGPRSAPNHVTVPLGRTKRGRSPWRPPSTR